MKNSYPLALCFLLFTPLSFGFSPWGLEQTELSLSYATSWTRFDRLHLFDGSERAESPVRLMASVFGVEYGLGSGITVEASLFHGLAVREDAVNATTHKLGDGVAAASYQILDERKTAPLTLAWVVSFKTPLSNYDPNRLSALGDGQTDVSILVTGGRYFSLGFMKAYGRLDLGYRFREGDPANEWFSYAEVGGSLPFGLSVRVFAQYVDSLGGLGLESPQFFAQQASSGRAPFPAVEEDWMKIGGGLGYQLLENLTVGASMSFVAIYSKNTSFDNNIEFYLSVNL